jgi:rubrerythrin
VQEQIVARGYRLPDVEPDVKGVVIGALTHPQRSLTVEDVLAGIRGNEQLTGTLYAKALARGLTGEARDVIARIRAEEHHHLAWVERALARRAWEAGSFLSP